MESRATYRVQVDEAWPIEVTVLFPGGEPVKGRLVDASIDGAAMEVSGAERSAIPVGETVQLLLVGGRVRAPLTVSAIVKNRHQSLTEGTAFHRVGFEFAGRDGLDEVLIAQALFALFNRRNAYRATPDPASPIGVHLRSEADGRRVAGVLLDISAKGVGVLVNPKTERSFAGVDGVEVSFELPGRDSKLTLVGVVRNRSLEKARIRYGVELDFERSEDSRIQRGVIRDFVLERSHLALAALAP